MKALVFLLIALLAVCLAENIFDFEVTDAEGNSVSLSKYADAKVILIVNTASNCGYTYTNYRELNQLYEKYHDQGLEILAFPCNQFADQEPGTNAEIQTFVRNYGVSFPVFAKLNVNGASSHPLYKYLKSNSDQTELAWNFVKFLVVEGEVWKRYNSRINPKKIEPDIVEILQAYENAETASEGEL